MVYKFHSLHKDDILENELCETFTVEPKYLFEKQKKEKRFVFLFLSENQYAGNDYC